MDAQQKWFHRSIQCTGFREHWSASPWDIQIRVQHGRRTARICSQSRLLPLRNIQTCLDTQSGALRVSLLHWSPFGLERFVVGPKLDHLQACKWIEQTSACSNTYLPLESSALDGAKHCMCDAIMIRARPLYGFNGSHVICWKHRLHSHHLRCYYHYGYTNACSFLVIMLKQSHH